MKHFPRIPWLVRYIDPLDLRPQRYDGLHFSKGAKLELGRRMAKVWIAW